jgi:hypothetical protein
MTDEWPSPPPPAQPPAYEVESGATDWASLYAGWYEWVTTNLGSDPKRAAAAANAAMDSAAHGRGFNDAAQAARRAWASAAGGAFRSAAGELGEADGASRGSSSKFPVLSAFATLAIAVVLEIDWLHLPICGPSGVQTAGDRLLYSPAVLVFGSIVTAVLMRIYSRAGWCPQVALVALGVVLATGVFMFDSVAMFGATFCSGPSF